MVWSKWWRSNMPKVEVIRTKQLGKMDGKIQVLRLPETYINCASCHRECTLLDNSQQLATLLSNLSSLPPNHVLYSYHHQHSTPISDAYCSICSDILLGHYMSCPGCLRIYQHLKYPCKPYDKWTFSWSSSDWTLHKSHYDYLRTVRGLLYTPIASKLLIMSLFGF